MLNELFTRIAFRTTRGSNSLLGLPVSAGHDIWLSVDNNVFPALMLPANRDDLRPDISLRGVEVLFSRQCVIDTDTGHSHEGCYSLVRLKDNDPDVVRLFLKILEERFCTLTHPDSNAEIAASIQEVATLFSRVDHKEHDIIGLWGELQLISGAGSIESAVQCWSTQRTAKYDFVCDRFVLDMKTTTRSAPQHRFSIGQLRPSGTFDAFIASLCVIEVQSGQTVGEVMDYLVEKIVDPDLRNALLTQCLSKGGCDLYNSSLTLQTYPNNAQPIVFRASDIPVPQVDEGDPIENIRFDVDLSHIVPLSVQESAAILSFEKTGQL